MYVNLQKREKKKGGSLPSLAAENIYTYIYVLWLLLLFLFFLFLCSDIGSTLATPKSFFFFPAASAKPHLNHHRCI